MVILFISLFVALCVKLDPGTHKVVHLGLAFKLGVIVTFVEGKLEDARQAPEDAERQSNGVADVKLGWEDAKRQCQDLVQKLTLLQTRGFKLWLAIVGLPTVQGHLSEGTRSDTICHTEMVG
jgi:hypothetical protein